MGVTRVKLSVVREVDKKFPGLMQDFLANGAKVAGINLEMPREVFVRVQKEHELGKAGTLIHKILLPGVWVADKVLRTDLGGCGGCGGRELEVNALTAKKELVK